jgi:hypothetical protein
MKKSFQRAGGWANEVTLKKASAVFTNVGKP